MRFKKKVMAFLLCGIIGVLNCLPAFAADDVAESVCAEGEEGIMPLSEACPKCGWGDFVCVEDIEWQADYGDWVECVQCDKKCVNCTNGYKCVYVEPWRRETTYRCNCPPCQYEETYIFERPIVKLPCECRH